MNFQFIPSDIDAYVRQIYGDRRLTLDTQVYTADFGDIAANGTAVKTIQISQQADFFACGAVIAANYEGDSINVGLLKTFLTDAGSGRPFTAKELNAANYMPMGTGWTFPFVRYLGGNTAVAVQLRETVGVEVTDVRVSLFGFQVRELA